MRPFVQYYDAIYSDKNYQQDCSILKGLVGDIPRPNILEIGSGTGNQSLIIAEWADVTAVETDTDFVEVMRSKIKHHPAISLFEHDIAVLEKQNFDAAAAFFHVVNYIHAPEALIHLFTHIAQRLKPNAPFLFDMWHGECVLNDPPHETTRHKKFASGNIIQHIAPQLDIKQKRVILNYTISFDAPAAPPTFHEIIDLHLWSQDEIVEALTSAGFEATAFFDGKNYPAPATSQSWNCWVSARKKKE